MSIIYKRLVFGLSMFSIIAFGTLLMYQKMPVLADNYLGQKILARDQYQIALAGSDNKTKFELLRLQNDEGKRLFVFKLFKSLGKSIQIELLGFENQVSLKEHYFVNGLDYFIFTGEVGAHSENLFVVKVVNGQLFSVPFSKNTESSETLVSDLPHFTYQIKNNNLEIVSYNRNYDKDPIYDNIIDTYQVNNDVFKMISSVAGTSNEITSGQSTVGGIK